MAHSLTCLMAQIDPLVGAIEDNLQKIMAIVELHGSTHDIIVFPELALTGYPPEDLLLHPDFIQRVELAIQTLNAKRYPCHIAIGHPVIENGVCYNVASVLSHGTTIARYAKQHLPNFGVFDEARYFSKGPAKACVFTLKNQRIGIFICEDIWQPGPIEQLYDANVSIVICLNASPFEINKQHTREALVKKYAQKGLFMIYVNCVGGQDELVFDGQSFAYRPDGSLCTRLPAFEESYQTLTLPETNNALKIAPLLPKYEQIYQALCCGLRDYVNKNNFPGVLLGLSGGIDSALTLAIAVDALGASRVFAVMMPSCYTATMSQDDAEALAKNLNVTLMTLPIASLLDSYLTLLNPAWNHAPPDTTEENLQARIRGTLLMALSNKTGHMLLTTGNKSEVAVGYTTLYGDMCGGFSVLKDLYKTEVYALSQYRNQKNAIIPERIMTRPPSAELSENQCDQDSLPSYAVLDAILMHYIEEKLSLSEIVAKGFDAETVECIIRLVTRSEHKRRQSAPGVKLTPRAFGRDWRYPITAR